MSKSEKHTNYVGTLRAVVAGQQAVIASAKVSQRFMRYTLGLNYPDAQCLHELIAMIDSIMGHAQNVKLQYEKMCELPPNAGTSAECAVLVVLQHYAMAMTSGASELVACVEQLTPDPTRYLHNTLCDQVNALKFAAAAMSSQAFFYANAPRVVRATVVQQNLVG